MPLHDALKPTAFRGAHHLHDLAGRKHVDLHHVTDVVRGDLDLRITRLVEPEAAQRTGRVVEARLLGVAELRARRPTPARRARAFAVVAGCPLLLEAELHRGESGFGFVGHGEHRIRLGLDDRARHLLPVLVEDLGHAQLSTNYANHECLG